MPEERPEIYYTKQSWKEGWYPEKTARAGNEAIAESMAGPRKQYESTDEHDARSRQQHAPTDEHDEWQSVYGPEQYGRRHECNGHEQQHGLWWYELHGHK